MTLLRYVLFAACILTRHLFIHRLSNNVVQLYSHSTILSTITSHIKQYLSLSHYEHQQSNQDRQHQIPYVRGRDTDRCKH